MMVEVENGTRAAIEMHHVFLGFLVLGAQDMSQTQKPTGRKTNRYRMKNPMA